MKTIWCGATKRLCDSTRSWNKYKLVLRNVFDSSEYLPWLNRYPQLHLLTSLNLDPHLLQELDLMKMLNFGNQNGHTKFTGYSFDG